MKDKPPAGLAAAGARLWRAVDLTEGAPTAALAILTEACRIADTLASLRKAVATDGVMTDSSQGPRVHPAIIEIRAQQTLLVKLLAELPAGVAQRGRGLYAVPPATPRAAHKSSHDAILASMLVPFDPASI